MIYNKNYIRSCCTHLNLFLIYVALYLTLYSIRLTYPTIDHILDYACCETKIIYYCSYSPLCLSILRLPFFRFPQTIAVVVLVRSSLHDIMKKEGTKLSLPYLIFQAPSLSLSHSNTHHLQRHKSFYLRSFNILETSPSSVQIHDIWKQERIFCELRAKLPSSAATTWEENCFSMFTLFLIFLKVRFFI